LSQVTYKDKSEKSETRKVYYEGSDTLSGGYNLCYNWDYGTASDAEVGRAWRVEKPATANLKYYAGPVTEAYDGFTGPGMVEIYVPNRRGQRVPVWTDQDCTIGTTILAVKDGSYALGAQTDGYDCSRAAQTVDRSTPGTVYAELFGIDILESQEQSQLLLLESEVSNIHSEVLILESEMAAIGAPDVTAVKSHVLVLESEMSTANESIDSLQSNVAANVGSIDSLATVLLATESEAAANALSIDSLAVVLNAVSEAESTHWKAIESELSALSEHEISNASLIEVASQAALAVSVELLLEESVVNGVSEALSVALLSTASYVSTGAYGSKGGDIGHLDVKMGTINIAGTDYAFVSNISLVAST